LAEYDATRDESHGDRSDESEIGDLMDTAAEPPKPVGADLHKCSVFLILLARQ
jgi:hypothetical protein